MPNHITNEILVKGTRKSVAKAIKSMIGYQGLIDFNSVLKMPKSLNIEASSLVEDFAAVLRNEVPRFFPIHHPEVKTAAEAMQVLKEKHKDSRFFNYERVLHQARLFNSNIKNYGYPTWYGWSIANWGTKWNAYDQFCDLEAIRIMVDAVYGRKKKHEGKKFSAYKKRVTKKRIQREIFENYRNDIVEVTVCFDTAWSAPHPVIRQFAARFPNVEVTHKYADEDIGSNCGVIEYYEGELFKEDIADNWSAMPKEDRRKWTKFALEVKYGDVDPTEYGYDKNWDFVEEEEEA